MLLILQGIKLSISGFFRQHRYRLCGNRGPLTCGPLEQRATHGIKSLSTPMRAPHGERREAKRAPPRKRGMRPALSLCAQILK